MKVVGMWVRLGEQESIVSYECGASFSLFDAFSPFLHWMIPHCVTVTASSSLSKFNYQTYKLTLHCFVLSLLLAWVKWKHLRKIILMREGIKIQYKSILLFGAMCEGKCTTYGVDDILPQSACYTDWLCQRGREREYKSWEYWAREIGRERVCDLG